MNIEEKAFELFKLGNSYGKIAKELGIGKTTAFNHIKKQELLEKIKLSNGVQNGSELKKAIRSEQIPNEMERSLNGRSERQKIDTLVSKSQISATKKIVEPDKILTPPKVFTGDDLLNKKFETLEFTGKFLELIGKPSKPFSGTIWGLPKGGKSNLSIRFADYLQEYFGQVLYVAGEEGESATLQQKVRDINGSKVCFLESRNKEDIREYIKKNRIDFVFIDSINTVGIDSDFLEQIKFENPKKSFVSIVQATKGGNFKGNQSLTHNCDFIIQVIDGIAKQEGRFAPASEMKIFEEPLYKKNEANVSLTKMRSGVLKKNPINMESLNNMNFSNNQKPAMKKAEVKSIPKKGNGIGIIGGLFLAGLGIAVVSSFMADGEKRK